jgi:hypothetical protein
MKSSLYGPSHILLVEIWKKILPIKKSLVISVFFWVKNCQISPKNRDQPPIGLDFRGEIWVFSP